MLKIETGKDNEILRTVAKEVKPQELQSAIKLWKEMLKYIKNPKNGGVWLAAPQVWFSTRVIIVSLLKNRDDDSFKTIIMINPEIIEHSENMLIDEEWCLSLPWQKGKVKRYESIKVNYIDEKKSKKTLVLSWLSARIVQHEIDHVNWILFIDYLT